MVELTLRCRLAHPPRAPAALVAHQERNRRFAAENGTRDAANASVHGAATLTLGDDGFFPEDELELDEDALAPTADELRRLARAITLRASGRSKQERIEEAFAVHKGGSPRWQRAYALFEAATR